MKRILVIEDEIKVAQALKQGLVEEGYAASVAFTGEEGFFLVTTEIFDVVILDLMLPGRNGLEILEALRRQDKRTLVLILSACDTLEDRVIGLDSGADDYMVKPFAVSELLARIRVLLRRERANETLFLQYSDIMVNLATREVVRGGKSINLTSKEFEVLSCLIRNYERFVTREMLAREVWKETMRATPIDNVIDVHVARLRKKIDREGLEKLIYTIRGVGFILKREEI